MCCMSGLMATFGLKASHDPLTQKTHISLKAQTPSGINNKGPEAHRKETLQTEY